MCRHFFHTHAVSALFVCILYVIQCACINFTLYINSIRKKKTQKLSQPFERNITQKGTNVHTLCLLDNDMSSLLFLPAHFVARDSGTHEARCVEKTEGVAPPLCVLTIRVPKNTDALVLTHSNEKDLPYLHSRLKTTNVLPFVPTSHFVETRGTRRCVQTTLLCSEMPSSSCQQRGS